MFSGTSTSDELAQMLSAGADDFLIKPLNPEAVLSTIRQAIERSSAALQKLRQMNILQQRYVSLSQREREVMDLVVTGRLNKLVGGDLGISEITVKAHRGKIMRKMQATTLVELAGMASRLGQHELALPA